MRTVRTSLTSYDHYQDGLFEMDIATQHDQSFMTLKLLRLKYK